jgi:hypothetical protein
VYGNRDSHPAPRPRHRWWSSRRRGASPRGAIAGKHRSSCTPCGCGLTLSLPELGFSGRPVTSLELVLLDP